MDRRRAISTLASAIAPLPVLAAGDRAAAGGSEKKGWCGGDAKLHQLFKAKWYYTWSPKTRPSKAAKFVPMIKGEWSLKQGAAIEQMGDITHLLGFNEPERDKQGDVPVAKAIELWPQLVEIAEKSQLRLGSPAPSSDRAGLQWLDAFMERAKKQKLRIDFVAAHWYKSRNAGEFEAFVKSLARQYRKPIWITEFNGWSGTEQENYKFLRDSLKFLERNQSVERYAYFNVSGGKPLSLLDKNGEPTRMGELYQEI